MTNNPTKGTCHPPLTHHIRFRVTPELWMQADVRLRSGLLRLTYLISSTCLVKSFNTRYYRDHQSSGLPTKAQRTVRLHA